MEPFSKPLDIEGAKGKCDCLMNSFINAAHILKVDQWDQ